MSVVGADSRQVITAYGTFPYSTVTAIDADRGTGSGILISPNHVLTAGHNAYSDKFATRLRSTISAQEDLLNPETLVLISSILRTMSEYQ